MSGLRIRWQDTCAILAIMAGLLFAATCLADDPWPPSVGPHTDKEGPCNLQPNDCFSDGLCHDKHSGDDPYLWTCPDGFAYFSYQRNQQRTFGYCYNTSGSCTYYDKYYCAENTVYKNAGCGNNNPVKCKYFVAQLGACGPP